MQEGTGQGMQSTREGYGSGRKGEGKEVWFWKSTREGDGSGRTGDDFLNTARIGNTRVSHLHLSTDGTCVLEENTKFSDWDAFPLPPLFFFCFFEDEASLKNGLCYYFSAG